MLMMNLPHMRSNSVYDLVYWNQTKSTETDQTETIRSFIKCQENSKFDNEYCQKDK